MVTVALCSTKGGSGKTLLALNLAERAHAADRRVIVVDCDYQEGSTGLALNRDEQAWPVVSGSVTVAGAEQLRGLRDSGMYDLVICDLPGSQNITLGVVLGACDLVLSPVGVGATDLMAAFNIWRMVQQLDTVPRVIFVPNHFPRGRLRLDALVEELEERGAEVCPVALQDRVAHVDSSFEGRGVCEVLPDSAAAAEVNALWEWLCGQLDMTSGGRDDDK